MGSTILFDVVHLAADLAQRQCSAKISRRILDLAWLNDAGNGFVSQSRLNNSVHLFFKNTTFSAIDTHLE